MAVPPWPGLGVGLDRDKLARAHEVYRKCGMTRRDDATLMKKLEPGWTGGLL
jgi:glucarate dehydratase